MNPRLHSHVPVLLPRMNSGEQKSRMGETTIEYHTVTATARRHSHTAASEVANVNQTCHITACR